MHGTFATARALALALAVLGVTSPVSAQVRPKKPAASPAATLPAAAPAPPPARPSLADTLTGPAKDDYMAARLLFGDHDYAGALVKFQSAYDRSKDPRLLFNMGACEKNLRHYAKTIAFFERYRADAGTTLSDADKLEVDRYLSELAPFVVGLRVFVNEAGATVYLDDELLGTSPLAAATRVDIGQRRIRVTKDGFTDYASTTVVSGTADVQVSAHLERVVHAGRLVVRAGLRDAISIDSQPLATGQFDGPLPSGGHQLQVSGKGMQTFSSEVVIQDKETRTIDVKLVPVAGVVPTWAWIVGGAAITAGAVVAGVFLFKPSPAGPSTIGTISPGTVTISSLR
jgi:hypothetical protein